MKAREVDEFRLLEEKLPSSSYYKTRIAINNFDKYMIQYVERKGLSENSVNADMLKFESIQMNNLNHPNIQKCFKLKEKAILNKKGSKIPITYGIYEYVGKNDLFDLISKNSGIHEEMAIYYLKQMAEAIHYLHEKKMYHRNIKVENFLVNDNFTQVKLKGLKYSSDKNFHVDHNIVGTKYYIAPEILKKNEYMGEEIDIFSLGVTLFIMIFGRPPFGSASRKDKSYKLIIEKNSEEFWNEVNLKTKKNISEELKDLIFSMIAYNPLDRPTAKLILHNPLLQSIEIKIAPTLLKMQYKYCLDEKKHESSSSNCSNPSSPSSSIIDSINLKNPFSTELHITMGEISPLR